MKNFQFYISFIPLAMINIYCLSSAVIYSLFLKNKYRDQEIQKDRDSHFLNRTIREWWLWTTKPLENALFKLKVSPNQLTIGGVVLNIFAGLSFYLGSFGAGGWLVLWAGTLDIFDGRIARRLNKVTQAGAYFDSVLDRYSEGVVFLGLLCFFKNSPIFYLVFIALLGSMMVSYTKARGEALGVNCKVGPMQRPERIVYLGVSSALSPMFAYFLKPWISLPDYFLSLMAISLIAVMVIYTSIYRMIYIMKQLNYKL